MNETNNNQQPATYRAVRIGDIADWRLIAGISGYGVFAWLKHSDQGQPLVPVIDCRWNYRDENLLGHIENAVYDNPQVLDDFSADIVVMTPRTLLVPSQVVADDDDEANRLYNQVYSASAGDLMQENIGEATALYSLTSGLNGFLQRTFSGARVHSHLAVMADRLRDRSADMPRLYVDIRTFGGEDDDLKCGEADFVAFDRQTLLMAATHRWNHPDDIRYHLFNIMQVFGLDPVKTQVSVSGPAALKAPLVQQLRHDLAYVVMTMMPNIAAKAHMPLPMSLLLRK